MCVGGTRYALLWIFCTFSHMPQTELLKGKNCVYSLFQHRTCNWKKLEMLWFDLNDLSGVYLGAQVRFQVDGGAFRWDIRIDHKLPALRVFPFLFPIVPSLLLVLELQPWLSSPCLATRPRASSPGNVLETSALSLSHSTGYLKVWGTFY